MKVKKIILKIIGIIVIIVITSIFYQIAVELTGHGLFPGLIMFGGAMLILWFSGLLKKKSKKLKTMEELQKLLDIEGYASYEKIKSARDKKLSDPKIKQEVKEEIEKLFMKIMR